MSDKITLRTVVGRLADLSVDACALLGAALIVDGVAKIYAPAAFIVAGAFLLAFAWMLARKSAG